MEARLAPSPLIPGILLSKKSPEPRKRIWFLEMVDKNGESNPRNGQDGRI